MNGYIKLHRQLLKWQWYGVPCVKDVFLHFLLRANLTDGFFNGTELKKGQLVVGRKDLAATLGFTEMQIRGAIDKLSSTNEITTKRTNKGTIITVVNWELYQGGERASNQQNNQTITNEQPTDNQRITTYKEEEEYKKSNKSKKKEKDISPKLTFGEYLNVRLTKNEYETLLKDYANAEECITYLDEYIEMKGYKAKSHYLAIKRWVVSAVNESRSKKSKFNNEPSVLKLPQWKIDEMAKQQAEESEELPF